MALDFLACTSALLPQKIHNTEIDFYKLHQIYQKSHHLD